MDFSNWNNLFDDYSRRLRIANVNSKMALIKEVLHETGDICGFKTAIDIEKNPGQIDTYINFGMQTNEKGDIIVDLIQGHKHVTPKIQDNDMLIYLMGLRNGCNLIKSKEL